MENLRMTMPNLGLRSTMSFADDRRAGGGAMPGGGSAAGGGAAGGGVKDSERNNCKLCSKEFSVRRGKHHCRQCGEIFCQDCSDYHSKLNSQGEPDDYGLAFRVCRKCFHGDGRIYIAPNPQMAPEVLQIRIGAQKNLRSEFDKALQENEKKRLAQKSKLRDLAELRKKMAAVRPADVRESSKAEEYRVTPSFFWSEDIGRCARCQQSFGLMGKKHHCRLCGELFCEKCSTKTDVDVECMDDDRRSAASDVRELSFIAVEPHGQVWVCTDPEKDESAPDSWSCETKLRLEPGQGGIRLHGRAADGERFATKEELLNEKALADKVYAPLKQMEAETERCLSRFGSLRHQLQREDVLGSTSGNTKSDKLELAKLNHDLQILLRNYKGKRKDVKMLPHSTERTKRIATAVLKATNEWYAYAYFSYNEHKKEVCKVFREEVLEQEWKHHPPKKLGSVYGFVMRMLYEWSTRPLIESYICGDGSGEFELPSGFPLQTTATLAEALSEMQREVRRVFLEADLDWEEYAAKIKQMTKTPLQGMSLLTHREDMDAQELLIELSHKCRAVEESEDWVVGAKAEKCKRVLALMRNLAEDPQ